MRDWAAHAPQRRSFAAPKRGSWSLGVAILVFAGCVNGCSHTAAPAASTVASAPGATAPVERFGTLMSEVGRRFQLLGKATQAGRWELANYELQEIGEIFTDDLPGAEPPPESKGTDLKGLAAAFAETNLPPLALAVQAQDPSQFATAWAAAAATCNGCHKQSGHPFIEVPAVPGMDVPSVTPIHGS